MFFRILKWRKLFFSLAFPKKEVDAYYKWVDSFIIDEYQKQLSPLSPVSLPPVCEPPPSVPSLMAMMSYIKFNLKLSLLCAFLNQILYLCNKVATIATNINIEDMRSVLFIVLILVSIMMEAKIRKPAVAGSVNSYPRQEWNLRSVLRPNTTWVGA